MHMGLCEMNESICGMFGAMFRDNYQLSLTLLK